MLPLLLIAAAAAQAAPSSTSFWEYVLTEDGVSQGWSIERKGSHCWAWARITRTNDAVSFAFYPERNETRVSLINSFSNAQPVGVTKSLTVTVSNGEAESTFERAFNAVQSGQYTELTFTMTMPASREILRVSRNITFRDGTKVVASLGVAPAITKSLDACLAGKSRS